MSLKDIWEEVKQDRINKKNEKKQQKLAKKKSRTGEQKAYIVFWVFFIIFIVCSCIFTSCKMLSCSNMSCSSFNFSSLVGISSETISELKEKVDKQDVLFTDEISQADWLKCIVAFNNSGLDICTKNTLDKTKLEGELVSQEFVLNGSEIGALYNHLFEIYGGDVTIDVLNLKITGAIGEDNKCVMESIVYMSLSDLLDVENLPNVYLYTKSDVQILQDKLTILDSEIKINNLSETAHAEIDEFLTNSKIQDTKNIANELICSTMESFAKLFDGKISIESSGFKFL